MAVAVGLFVGFVSGVVFATLLAITENRKRIQELLLLRVIVLGMLAAAVWPLLTSLPDDMMIVLCPLGALCASVPIVIVLMVGARSSVALNCRPVDRQSPRLATQGGMRVGGVSRGPVGRIDLESQ